MKRPDVSIANFYAERKNIEKKLLPCPLCGNKEIELSLIHPQYIGKPDMNEWLSWEICCPECGAMFQYGKTSDQTWADVKEDIIAAWNRREE